MWLSCFGPNSINACFRKMLGAEDVFTRMTGRVVLDERRYFDSILRILSAGAANSFVPGQKEINPKSCEHMEGVYDRIAWGVPSPHARLARFLVTAFDAQG